MMKQEEYWAISDEIHNLTEEKYDELGRCPNCQENNPKFIEWWPITGRQKGHIGNFWHRKCLSCGQYFSLWTNYLKVRKPTVIPHEPEAKT